MRDVFTTALRYKLWFDLWGARQRTLQAVLTIAIGTFAVGTTLGALLGVTADVRNTWASVAAPTIVFRISPFANDALITALRNRPDIAALEPQMEQGITWRTGPHAPWQPATLIARDDYAAQQLSLLLLDEGAWPAGRIIAVERRFGLVPGDQIEIKIGDHELAASVGGTLYNRSAVASSIGGDLVIYTTRARFAELTGQHDFSTIMASVPNYTPESGELAATRLQNDLAEHGFRVLPATFNRSPSVDPTKAWFDEMISGIGFVIQTVAVIAMALSLLLIYTTVTAIIAQQTAQIGELKAIGASSRQIVHVYLLLVGAYGVMAALIALPMAVAGANILRYFLVLLLGMNPGPMRLDWEPLLLQLALCLLAPLLIALQPILRGAHITIREAMSSYGLSSTGNRLDALLGRLTWLSRVFSLAISNVFRNWSRLFLTQLALGGAGITLIAVLSTQATLNYTSSELMRSIYRYQVQLDTKRLTTLPQLAKGAQAPGVEAVEIWRSINIVLELSNGQQRNIQLNGLPLPSAAYAPQLYAGRWLQPGDRYALTLTEAVASELGVMVGDHVRVSIPAYTGTDIWASEKEWEVVGIVREPFLRNLSRIGFAPRATLIDEAGTGIRANRVQLLIPAAAGPDAPAIASTLRSFYDDHGMEMQRNPTDTVYERSTMEASNLQVISILLLVMAAIMAAVGGVALSGVLQISVLERRREIGVLRAIGATPMIVRTLFVIEGLILGWLSWLIALAFSYPTGRYLSYALVRTLGISIIYQYSWIAVALWIGLASLIGVLASIAPAQRAISASVQESLSYE